MPENDPAPDPLTEALAALRRARAIILAGNVERHREALAYELTQAELSISRAALLLGRSA